MSVKYAALKLGLQLIEQKLAESLGDPSFCASEDNNKEEAVIEDENQTELPTSDNQKRDRSAKVHPPRVITIQ